MGSLPGPYNFIVPQGDDFDRTLTYSDENGVPINLSGWTARMQVRTQPSSPDVVLSLTSPTDIVLGGAAGTINIIIANAVTAALTPNQYVYDLELIDTSSKVGKIIKGKFTVDAEVTK